MKKTAFLFPGQGSQSIGMGKDLFDEFDEVRELFDMAEEICEISLKRLCFQGPMEKLTETVNLQPAITVVNLACLAALEKAGAFPDLSAGHSLGEFSALAAAGIISRENTIKLVYERGRLMHREAVKNRGVMHAVVGLTIDAVNKLIEQSDVKDRVAVANHNTQTQIVITGEPEAVKKISETAAAQGGKAVPLKVSGAWHSHLIKGAEDEFREILSTVEFKTPNSIVIHNVTAGAADTPEEIRNIMAEQLCSPVKWYDSMQRMISEHVDVYVEVGPGMVLRGLMKKILPRDGSVVVAGVNNLKSLEKFAAAL